MPKKYVHHSERFDDYIAIVNGDKQCARLTIFKMVNHDHYIVYQADCFTKNKIKKLRRQISEFRYAFTEDEYEVLK